MYKVMRKISQQKFKKSSSLKAIIYMYMYFEILLIADDPFRSIINAAHSFNDNNNFG